MLSISIQPILLISVGRVREGMIAAEPLLASATMPIRRQCSRCGTDCQGGQ